MAAPSGNTKQLDKRAVLTKAVLRASEALGLSREQLAEVVGRNRSGLIRDGVDPESKSGELAMMLVRIYRALYALMGGDEAAMKHWLRTENRYFHTAPADRLQHIDGLVQVLGYLDAMRGKI